jgi:hypothetical protein
VVCLKTLAFVGFIVRRGRRQQRALATVNAALATAEAAAPAPGDPSRWRLQWAEPGVLLVENTSGASAARDVELSATLTASSGTAATVEQTVRFVGTGACFTARFASVDPWLAACTLSYSMAWRTPEGERRRECRTGHSVVPVPDLTLEAA